MDQEKKYMVLILQISENFSVTLKIAARDLTLAEAAAWISSYNYMMVGQPLSAVISEESSER